MAQSMNPSGTPLNLCYINCSPPLNVSELEWEKWLMSKYLPDLVYSGSVTRAALYKEISFAMIPNPSHPLNYMVLYQTDFKALQDSEKYRLVSGQAGASKFNGVGYDDIRNYKLIQDYNPFGVDNSPGPQLLTVEMHPEDREDFEDWYRSELLPKLSSLPGYRRCRRYQITARKEERKHYLAIHELESLNQAFRSQSQHDEASTPRMEKHIEASEKSKSDSGNGFVRRGWTLVHAEGYETGWSEVEVKSEEEVAKESNAYFDYGGWLGLRGVLSQLFGGGI